MVGRFPPKKMSHALRSCMGNFARLAQAHPGHSGAKETERLPVKTHLGRRDQLPAPAALLQRDTGKELIDRIRHISNKSMHAPRRQCRCRVYPRPPS